MSQRDKLYKALDHSFARQIEVARNGLKGRHAKKNQEKLAKLLIARMCDHEFTFWNYNGGIAAKCSYCGFSFVASMK